MTTVADVFIDTLENAGIKRIYGIVGDSLNGLTNVLQKRKTIEWVHTRHEEVAAFAAGEKAQLTGELAVCAGSCGPGNLHLINDLYDCQRSNAPVACSEPKKKIIHPQYLARLVDKKASEDAVFTCDVGTPTGVWAARYLKMNGKRQLLGSFNHGSMANY